MKYLQSSLEYKVLNTIKENQLFEKGDCIVAAVSGGADSLCLLYLLNEFKDDLGISLEACHYNHKLREEESDRDEKFVKKFCQEWGIECTFGSAPSKNFYKNEEEARNGRYLFFSEILENGGGGVKIAIGHNANDLSETFIFRLIRGTGIKGLRAIPLVRENFIRPLLYTPRSEIEAYLQAKRINYITDKTNFSLKYTRNFLRLKVIPLLLEINPNLFETIKESILSIEEDYAYIEAEAKKYFNKILISENSQEIVLELKGFSVLPSALRKNISKIAIEKLGILSDITSRHIKEVDLIAKKGEGGKFKLLPHSLRVACSCGKIIFSKDIK